MNNPPLPTEAPKREYTQLGFVQRLQYILAKTHQLVFDKIQEKRERNSSLDSDKEATSFKVGDEVLLYRPQVFSGDSRKLSMHWFGPYKVTNVGISGKVYYLQDQLGDPFKYPISVSMLKKYTRRIGEESFTAMPENLESTKDFNKDKDDLSSPNALLQWDNPNDNFVPTNILPSGDSEEIVEETAVLESLKNGQNDEILQRPIRAKRKPSKFVVPQTTYVNGKKRKGRMYQ